MGVKLVVGDYLFVAVELKTIRLGLRTKSLLESTGVKEIRVLFNS